MIPRMNTFGLEWVSPACLNLPRWNGSRCLGGPISIALHYRQHHVRHVGGLLGYVSWHVSVSGIPLGWGGSLVLGESQSRIYPNMCAKFGCGPTVVSKKGVYRQTDKGTLQLYIVETSIASWAVPLSVFLLYDHFCISFSLVSTYNVLRYASVYPCLSQV